MMPRYGNEMGSTGARGKRMTTMRRSLLVGALAASVAGLGVSAAVAVGPLGSPPEGPSTIGGQGTSMMSGTGMTDHKGASAKPMDHKGASMMSGTGMTDH